MMEGELAMTKKIRGNKLKKVDLLTVWYALWNQ